MSWMGFPGGASGKEPTCQSRRHEKHGFNPQVRKIPPGGGHGNPLQCSCLENPMDIDIGAGWRAQFIPEQAPVRKNQERVRRVTEVGGALGDRGGLLEGPQRWVEHRLRGQVSSPW